MALIDKIKNTYPELTDEDFGFFGSIRLQNDSDGEGDFIANGVKVEIERLKERQGNI